ncbi:MAG: amidohydrolase family protein, partial [Chloroflexota bacterium]
EGQKYRPLIVKPHGETDREYWMVDGRIRGLVRPIINPQQFEEMSRVAGRNMATPEATREMENLDARLEHLDELGIDVQVVYPSIFISPVADKPEWDVAICQGYNRWLADLWKRGNNRIRWVCVPPLLDIAAAIEEMRFSKENGACAVFMRGIEKDRLLHDPYHYPIFAEAERLDLAIGVHIAHGTPWLDDLLDRSFGGFWRFRMATIGSFHSVIGTGLPQQFPKLRMAFVEAAAGWVPYVLKDLTRRLAARGRTLPENPLKEYRLYVTCQTDDDLDYVMQYSGEDNLVIGTDYGHSDQSTEVEALRNLKDSGQLSDALYNKIAYENAKRLYAL